MPRPRELRSTDVPAEAAARSARHLRAVAPVEAEGLTEEQFRDDVAAACARFGIGYRHTGSRETRLLKAMLKINREEGRPATSRELAAAAEISSGGGGQVALSLREAQGRGWFVKLRPGLYVITESGERELAR